MATTFGLLINANVKGENNIKRLGNSMQGVQGKVKNLKMAVGGLSTAFKALGAALVVGGFSSFIKSTIDQADALGKLSTRTGIAANSLQAFVNAGKLADVSQSQLETGLKTFARTSFEAAQGVSTYSDAYASLGVSVKKSDGSLKASDDLLKEIADKFKDLPNGPEKAAIAMRLFGKSGADMITLLNGGSEALERFNYEVSENFSQNAEYFNDQITILQIQFDGFRKQLLDALLPALNAILEVFGDLFSSGQDFGPLFKVIEIGIRGVASVVLGLVQSMRFFVRTIRDLLSIAQLVVQRKFGAAVDVAKTGLADTRSQFFKDIEAQQKVLFGRSEVGTDYGGGGAGFFNKTATKPGAGAAGKLTATEKTPEQKAAEEYEKMLQNLVNTAAEFNTITISAIEVTNNHATAFDGIKDAASGYLENIGTMREGIANLASTGFQGLEDALTSLVTTGKANFVDFAQTILQATARMIIQQTILRSIMQAIGAIPGGALPTSPFGGPQVVSGGTGIDGSAFGATAFSKIIPFSPFAKGGVISQPTMSLMGEAGPEAVLPLKRGAGGKLGVATSGGMGDVVVNVDAAGSSVQGNNSQANQLGKAIGAAVQQELIKQKKPGGLLA
jgi:hypothetical protein